MDYKLVLMHSPLKTFTTNPISRKMFGDNATMRIKGFHNYYGDKVIPFSNNDFISDHIIVCNQSDMSPVASFKVISKETCDKYNVEFPLLADLKEYPENELLYHQAKKIISKTNMTYLGALASISERSVFEDVYKILILGYFNYMKERGLSEGVLTAASSSRNFIKRVGFKPISEQEVKIKSVSGTPSLVCHFKEASKECLDELSGLQTYWNHRLEIREDRKERQGEAA